MQDESPYEQVYKVLVYIASTVAMGTLIYLFIKNIYLFYLFGFVVFIVVLAVILDFGIRRVTRHTFRDVGQWSTISQDIRGKVATHLPMALETPRQEAKTKVTLVVPTVAELLKEGMLGTADLLLGYKMDSNPHWGNWGNINTFCIAGRSRSGKTITLYFIIIQALLNGAIVWVADPHGAGRKQSALKQLLGPLEQFIKFACTDSEIATMADDFIDLMQRRIEGETDDFTPHLFVCDEFNGVAEENERLYEVVNRCAREWAGVYGYAAIAAHEWTLSGNKMVKLRRNLHAKFVHKIDQGYSSKLLNSRKYAQLTEKLRTGNCYFQAADGDTDIIELRTPLGTREDSITIAERLLQIAGPVYEPKQIVQPAPRETETFHADIEAQLSLPAPEVKSFQTREEKLAEIARLRGLGLNQSQVIQNIWKVKPGATQTYQDALAEYKQLLDQLVRSA